MSLGIVGLDAGGRGGSGLMVLLPPDTTGPSEVSPATPLLGLPLLRRAVLAAQRAGFERVLVITPAPAEIRPLLRGAPATVLSPDEQPPEARRGRIVLLASTVLAQPEGLRALREMPIEPERLYRGSEAVAVIETAGPDTVLSAASAGLGTADLFAALEARFPAVPWSWDGRDRMTLTRLQDVPRAEAWLLRGLVKDSEGFMSRHVERRISLALTRRLVWTRVSPTTMTLVSLAIGLAGAPFFLSARPAWQLTGALLFLAHSVLDGCDGELARLRFQESRRGGLLDFWGDNVVHVAVFLCMGIGWGLAAGAAWPLLPAAAAVAGVLGSAGFVHWHTMRKRGPSGPLFTSTRRSAASGVSALMDALARRDFIYLVVAVSALGKASWFLVLAGIGAPIYLLIVLWMARGDVQGEARRS